MSAINKLSNNGSPSRINESQYSRERTRATYYSNIYFRRVLYNLNFITNSSRRFNLCQLFLKADSSNPELVLLILIAIKMLKFVNDGNKELQLLEELQKIPLNLSVEELDQILGNLALDKQDKIKVHIEGELNQQLAQYFAAQHKDNLNIDFKEEFLRQIARNSGGHCEYSSAQQLAIKNSLNYNLDSPIAIIQRDDGIIICCDFSDINNLDFNRN